MRKNWKVKNSKKIMATFLIFFVFFFCAPRKTQAAWIPGIDPIIDAGLEQLAGIMKGVLIGALKQEAINMMNDFLNNMVGDGSSEIFVTNWEDHLVKQPENKASLYLNDYLSRSTRGRNTVSGYSAEGYGGGSGNYMADLSSSAKTKIEESKFHPEATYEGNPAQMFQDGSFKKMENYFSGVNNSWAFNGAAESAYDKKLEKEEKVAEIKTVANQGFNGTSTYPGILVKEEFAAAKKVPYEVLANAQSIPEIVTAMITTALTKAVQQGFSGLQKTIAPKESDSQNQSVEGKFPLDLEN